MSLPATLSVLSMIPHCFAYVPRIVHDHFHSVVLELVFEFQKLEESFKLLQYCLVVEVGITTNVNRSSCCTRHVLDTNMSFEL